MIPRKSKKSIESAVYAVLENIRSVHNVGAMFRTADAAGVAKIFLVGFTPAPVDRFGNPRKDFAKAALGAERTVPWESVSSAGSLLRRFKKEGVQVVALEQSTCARDYRKIAPRGPWALVVGNEVDGVSGEILSAADFTAEIPMAGKKESLNASVAFGIALFRLLQK